MEAYRPNESKRDRGAQALIWILSILLCVVIVLFLLIGAGFSRAVRARAAMVREKEQAVPTQKATLPVLPTPEATPGATPEIEPMPTKAPEFSPLPTVDPSILEALPKLELNVQQPAEQKTFASIPDVVEAASKSVVGIIHYQPNPRTGKLEEYASGSGFIVGKNDIELLIATNNHVIDSATKIEITFIDDSVLEATIKGTDSIADLAILAVPLDTISADTLSSIRVATLGDSEAVRLGEMAIAIGNALGYGQSVTVGYISAKDRTVTVDGNEMILLQTDAAINGGNSGGPLFNTKGEVIGINSVKYADTSVEGMCFAIPISRAIPILNELMNRETLAEEDKGFLGVSTRTVTNDIATLYGWPIGAYIVSILENSPAEAAGLYIGDIVTSVNGVKIVTADQLVAAVASYRHGSTIELVVQRNINGKYEEVTISAILGKKADVEAAAEESESESNKKIEESEDSGSSESNRNNKRPGSNR